MSETATERGSHVPPAGLPRARQALIDWVREGGPAGREFLQVHLQALSDGHFRVRHVTDRSVPADRLEVFTDPYRAREIAQTTDDGAHRPLKTAPDLRRGWSFETLDDRGLWTALDYLYPACVGHWHAGREGTLRVTPWKDTAARQSGMYSAVRLLPEPALRDTVRACCGDAVCLRRVAWGLSDDAPEPLPSESAELDGAPAPAGDSEVACPEACSIFISFARAVLTVERSPRAEVAGLASLNEPETRQIRALVAAAAGGTAPAPREGEFDQPLNRRRLRYLAVRLAAAASEALAPEVSED